MMNDKWSNELSTVEIALFQAIELKNRTQVENLLSVAEEQLHQGLPTNIRANIVDNQGDSFCSEIRTTMEKP
ncbi:MAG: hypothetical protein KDH94_00730 [Coxiellaceae bacterium]|nr:hypothetical protein [Coxiellaceae bacterium]